MLSHRIWVKYLAGAQSFTTVALFALYGYAAPACPRSLDACATLSGMAKDTCSNIAANFAGPSGQFHPYPPFTPPSPGSHSSAIVYLRRSCMALAGNHFFGNARFNGCVNFVYDTQSSKYEVRFELNYRLWDIPGQLVHEHHVVISPDKAIDLAYSIAVANSYFTLNSSQFPQQTYPAIDISIDEVHRFRFAGNKLLLLEGYDGEDEYDFFYLLEPDLGKGYQTIARNLEGFLGQACE